MSEPTPDDASLDHERLADLADEFARRYRRGERPALEEYAQRHPALAGQIRELFPAMIAMEQSGAASLEVAPSAERVGAVIGRYKLLERLGEGGFGTVFMAEQQYPVRRRVALKLVKPGVDTRKVIARFEAERQALALMDHPNIAKVFDAGATDAGRPYFVMELVKGVPITTYCDELRLTPEQRLELFLPVCQAVQHAHQKGIIHRDLKPSNVLVALYDGKPVPKVIDFGVAKATGERLVERTLFTGFGEMVGTLQYMSPEQAELNQLDVDTHSDVYSLGVLLYELLTGTTPLEGARLKQAALIEALRVIREEEPPRPSTSLSTSDALPTVAANRGLEPKRLSGLVRGDLDWIVMKCLEKDRSRRYESASALAADVRHHLADEPVIAAAPSRAYRMRRFVRRNKPAVLTSASIVIVLIAGIVGTTIGLMGQARQRARAELREQDAQIQAAIAKAVNQFQSDMLASADPAKLLGDKVRVLQVVTAAVAELDAGKLSDDPLVEASVRLTIGRTLNSLARYDLAEPNLRRSLEIRRKLLPAVHLDVAESLDSVAGVLHDQGRFAESEPLHREVLEIRRKLLPAKDPLIASALIGVAWVLRDRSERAEAERVSREALDILRESLPAGHPELAPVLARLGEILAAQGKLVEAEPICREALEIRRRALPAGHPKLAVDLESLAEVLWSQGKLAESEPLYYEALDIRRKTLPAGHPEIARSLGYVGWLLKDEGRLVEAEAMLREALEIRRKALPSGHPNIALCAHSLGMALQAQGRFAEAEQLFREALDIFQITLPVSADVPNTMHSLASVLQDQGRLAEAESLFREALNLARKTKAVQKEHELYGQSLDGLGALLRQRGKLAEAEPLLAELYQWAQRTQYSPAMAARYIARYGPCLVQLHRFQEAEQPLREAHRRLQQTAQPNDPLMREVVAALAEVCDYTNRPDEAAKWRAELALLRAATQPTTAPAT